MPKPAALPAVAWSRPEPFGAWVRLGDGALLAVDHALAASLGVAHGASPAIAPRPLELHLAVTARCPLPCSGCYLDARPDGEVPSFEAIAARLAAARDAGISLVAFGGGEPLTRDDLGRLAVEARRHGLVPVLTTSGAGLTEGRASDLRAFAQVNVSHDGEGSDYAQVRGFDGAPLAERALRLLAEAGVPAGVNVVLTADTFPGLFASCERFADLGAAEVQLLRYKPAGRARGEAYAARRLTRAQIDELFPTIARLVARGRLRVRIDCAMVPLLSRALLEAVPDAAQALKALGVFGCEAARSLAAMRVDGSIAACSLFSREPTTEPALTPAARLARGASDSASPAAAGLDAWDLAPELTALRAYHAAPPEPCRSCPLFSVCRGGCQVVSRHERADATCAPDPECPRVVAFTVSGAGR